MRFTVVESVVPATTCTGEAKVAPGVGVQIVTVRLVVFIVQEPVGGGGGGGEPEPTVMLMVLLNTTPALSLACTVTRCAPAVIAKLVFSWFALFTVYLPTPST